MVVYAMLIMVVGCGLCRVEESAAGRRGRESKLKRSCAKRAQCCRRLQTHLVNALVIARGSSLAHGLP